MFERLAIVTRLEFVSVARLWWIRMFAAAFALLAVGMSWSAGSAREIAGVDGFARSTVALVPLVLLLVPLVAILLGVTGQTSEPGADAFLHAQPVTRFEVLLGRWLGEGTALAGALLVGFGAGGAIVALGAGAADVARYAIFMAATVALALSFLAIAAFVSALFDRRVVALAVGAFTWFFFVLLFDALALSSAMWLTGRAGARVLMLSVFGNPADLMRVLTLSLAGTPHLLGAAGESWTRLLGGPAWSVVLSCAGLAAWTIAPLAAARFVLNRRDL